MARLFLSGLRKRCAKGFSKQTIEGLQLDGKLAYLTFQNRPLVERLVTQKQISDPVHLAREGFYEPAAWLPLIGQDLPTGLDAEAYATHMAALVKRSYPTETLGAQIRRGQFELTQNADLLAETAHFFEKNEGFGG